MKILFVCFEYCGDKDPGAQCIHQLRSALYATGAKSDVITYAWKGEKEQPLPDQYGTVYPVRTWYRHARVKRTADGTIHMSPVQWVRVAVTRGAAMLLDGRCYAQRGVPVYTTHHLGRRLQALCQEHGYDWVVSVSYPFANHLAAARWTPSDTKLAFYNLDPYWNNGTYPPRLTAVRAAEEAEVYRKADCVFCTPEQLQDYQGAVFRDVFEKIHPLPYPKLAKPVIQERCPIQFDPDCINLLYLGTVYGDIRKPEALFRLFAKAAEQEPRLRLYIVGKKFGVDADRYLTEYSEKLGDKLHCYAPIPPEQTTDLLLRADVLVNMGNTVRNQMPSKVVEYISTGKPILNLSVNEECSTLGLIQRYANGLQVFEKDLRNHSIVQATVDFCRQARGKELSWQEVRKAFPEMELSQLTRYFLATLTQNDGACESQK